jgi:hypothetical protein
MTNLIVGWGAFCPPPPAELPDPLESLAAVPLLLEPAPAAGNPVATHTAKAKHIQAA